MPEPPQLQPCTAGGVDDGSCPGEQKCCGSCPKTCQDPDFDRNIKPGNCPRETYRSSEECFMRCSKDENCPGNQKCCGSCQRQCVAPDERY